jgi:hypothetical protein
MFLRRNTRPAVKKYSELVDNKSHVQKKYISLMMVPSYSTGKTRSLRVPRKVFYVVLVSIMAISATIAGLYIRSNYFQQAAQEYSAALDETQEAFMWYRVEAALEQHHLMEESGQLQEHLTEEQRRFQQEFFRIRQEHRSALEILQDAVDDLERRLIEFDDDRQQVIESLGPRAAIIPPVANLLNQLHESQAILLEYSNLRSEPAMSASVIGLAAFGELNYTPTAITEESLLEQIEILLAELEIQQLLYEEIQDIIRRMDPHLRTYPTLWPVRGRISSGFGWRGNAMGGGGGEFHTGIDIPAPVGTPIRATGGGTVIRSDWYGGYGNTVIIDHGFGLTTLYAHNSVNLVRVGQRVERGDIIARVGTTGRVTGPHVHYEVRRNGRPIDPRPFLLE